MKTINVKRPFPFSPNGFDVVHYAAGIQQVPDEVAEVALAEKWAAEVPTKAKDEEKADEK